VNQTTSVLFDQDDGWWEATSSGRAWADLGGGDWLEMRGAISRRIALERRRLLCAASLSVTALAMVPAATGSAAGCHDNGSEMAAIAVFGQDGMTAGEVWGGMASTQHSDFSEVEDGPGVVARHMHLQMDAYCGE
jgi:hypothetical protein